MSELKPMTIELRGLKGGTPKQRADYMKAIKIAEKVINSQPFKERILNYQYIYNGTVIKGFKHNNGLSNGKVYALFRSGWDKFHTEKDNDLDLYVTLYYKRYSGVKGYTYRTTPKIWVNTKFFNGSQDHVIAGIVGNLIHEYCHNLEFDHAFDYNPTRKFTVPYAFGDIAYELTLDYFAVDQSEMVWTCRKYRTWYFRSTTKCKWEPKRG